MSKKEVKGSSYDFDDKRSIVKIRVIGTDFYLWTLPEALEEGVIVVKD